MSFGGPAFYTSLGPSRTPGGFSQRSFGTTGLPFGFGFPSFGDPLMYFMPAASSFMINRLLGFANGSAVNINIGPTPSHLGFGGLLQGAPFWADSACPGGDPFTMRQYGPSSPGFGTSFGGGGHFSPPGFGGPFLSPFQPGPTDPIFNPFLGYAPHPYSSFAGRPIYG